MCAVHLNLEMAQTRRENRLYFGEKNISGMLAVLEPLHAILERGPQTLKETSFFQVQCLLIEFENDATVLQSSPLIWSTDVRSTRVYG